LKIFQSWAHSLVVKVWIIFSEILVENLVAELESPGFEAGAKNTKVTLVNRVFTFVVVLVKTFNLVIDFFLIFEKGKLCLVFGVADSIIKNILIW